MIRFVLICFLAFLVTTSALLTWVLLVAGSDKFQRNEEGEGSADAPNQKVSLREPDPAPYHRYVIMEWGDN